MLVALNVAISRVGSSSVISRAGSIEWWCYQVMVVSGGSDITCW